uniref:Uncharacterized protein n=1 Tax=Arundo donax TaxID=35708 RepID=A0A0A9H8I9_ARUDO
MFLASSTVAADALMRALSRNARGCPPEEGSDGRSCSTAASRMAGDVRGLAGGEEYGGVCLRCYLYLRKPLLEI